MQQQHQQKMASLPLPGLEKAIDFSNKNLDMYPTVDDDHATCTSCKLRAAFSMNQRENNKDKCLECCSKCIAQTKMCKFCQRNVSRTKFSPMANSFCQPCAWGSLLAARKLFAVKFMKLQFQQRKLQKHAKDIEKTFITAGLKSSGTNSLSTQQALHQMFVKEKTFLKKQAETIQLGFLRLKRINTVLFEELRNRNVLENGSFISESEAESWIVRAQRLFHAPRQQTDNCMPPNTMHCFPCPNSDESNLC